MAECFVSRGGAPLDANGKTPLSQLPAHAASATTYGAGNGSNYGHVKLSDSTSTTSGVSGGVAATPTAVKAAYDLANTANSAARSAQTTANSASSTASSAKTTANAAMPKSGGTFTGTAVAYDTAATTKGIRNVILSSSSSTTITVGTLLGVWE